MSDGLAKYHPNGPAEPLVPRSLESQSIHEDALVRYKNRKSYPDYQRMWVERFVAECKDMRRDLARERAVREFQRRYERRFHPHKWKYLGELHVIISFTEEIRFCKPLHEIFKRKIFRSSKFSKPGRAHPVQRVTRHALLHIFRTHYSAAPPEVVENITTLVDRLYDCYDIYCGCGDYDSGDDEDDVVGGVSQSCVNENSYIDPREMLCALYVLGHPSTTMAEPVVRWWFDLYAYTEDNTPVVDYDPRTDSVVDISVTNYAGDSVPWRPFHMALLTTSTCDWEYELVTGLATRAFLGSRDDPEAVSLLDQEHAPKPSAAASGTIDADLSAPSALPVEGSTLAWDPESTSLTFQEFWNTCSSSLSELEEQADNDPEGQGTITRERLEQGLQSVAGRQLLGELQRQMWARCPDDARINVLRMRVVEQKRVVTALERRIFKPNIANMFEEWKPRQKFNMWRRWMATSRARVLAKSFSKRKRQVRGIWALVRNMRRRKRFRRLLWLADRHADRHYRREAFRTWQAWTERQLAIQAENLARAVLVYNTALLRMRVLAWRVAVIEIKDRREELTRAAFEMWRNRQLQQLLEQWKANVDKQVAEKEAEANQQLLFGWMTAADEERERRDMAEEEKKLVAFYEEEQRIADEKEQEAVWEERHKAAVSHLKELEQERERLAAKAQKMQDKLDHDHGVWSVLAGKGIAAAEKAAMEWLTTREGKKYVKEQGKIIYNIPDDELLLRLTGPAGDTINVRNSTYQLKQEIGRSTLAGKLFYYNSETMERYYVDSISLQICRDIVSANYIATECNKIKDRIAEYEADHNADEHVHAAARKIQAMWRVGKARRFMRRLIKRDWEKRVDPASGELFYYNKRTGTSKWTKPFALGPSDDLADPPPWCVLQGPRGSSYYYYNRDTREQRNDRPPGFILCCECQLYFATKRCTSTKPFECTGRPFCDDCWKTYHDAIPARSMHEPASVAVRRAFCKVCHDPANIMCFGCIGDVYCEKCSNVVHAQLSSIGEDHDDWTYIDWPD